MFQQYLTDWNVFYFADVASEAFLSAISVGNLQCLLFCFVKSDAYPVQSMNANDFFANCLQNGVRISRQVSSALILCIHRRLLFCYNNNNNLTYKEPVNLFSITQLLSPVPATIVASVDETLSNPFNTAMHCD